MTKASEPSIDDLMNAGEYRKAFEAIRKERDVLQWKLNNRSEQLDEVNEHREELLSLQKRVGEQFAKERDELRARQVRMTETLTQITDDLIVEREKLAMAREALEFYANNSGLYIDHRTNAFMSRDSDGKDFHGAKAREALGELTDKPDAR